MPSKTRTFLACALAIAASSLAMADDGLVTVKSETVRYDDVRLSSPVGVAVLYGRLRHAAERACATLDRPDLSAKTKYRACFDEALRNAVVTVNHPGLTQFYDQKRGVTTPASAPVQSVTVVANSP